MHSNFVPFISLRSGESEKKITELSLPTSFLSFSVCDLATVQFSYIIPLGTFHSFVCTSKSRMRKKHTTRSVSDFSDIAAPLTTDYTVHVAATYE